jgi:hypothetical protein
LRPRQHADRQQAATDQDHFQCAASHVR